MSGRASSVHGVKSSGSYTFHGPGSIIITSTIYPLKEKEFDLYHYQSLTGVIIILRCSAFCCFSFSFSFSTNVGGIFIDHSIR